MKELYSNISSGKAAIVTAVCLIIMTILAPIANFSILNGLVVSTDAAKTFANISASQGSFRIAILFFYIVAMLDFIIAWGLFIFLKPLNKGLSLLTAWFRIVYATLLVASLFYLLNVLQFINGAGYLSSFDSNQLQTQVMLSIKNFSITWEFGLILFGFHLLLLGYLMFKAGYMKKILGVLLVIASLGYLIDGFGRILSSGYNTNVAAFTFVGEVVLIFWLLLRGRKVI